MKKESLTNECIAKELLQQHSWKPIVFISLLWSAVILAVLLFLSSLDHNPQANQGLSLALYVLFLIMIVFGSVVGIVLLLISTWKKRQGAVKCEFHVVVDTLEKAADETDCGINTPGSGKYWHLKFASFGEYALPKQRYYSWSNDYAMTDEGVYNTSVPNDTFYIVTVDDKTILAVYNTKFFEYKGDKEGNSV